MAINDYYKEVDAFLKKTKSSFSDKVKLDISDLVKAVRDNDADEVARALNAWVIPNEEDGMARIPLPIATDNNNKLIVGMLLRNKAKPNVYGTDGQTPLFKAVFWENEDIVELLMEAGADINLANKDGKTPMSEAMSMGNEAIIDILKGNKERIKARQIEKDKSTHERLRKEGAAAKAKRIMDEKKARLAEEEKQEQKRKQTEVKQAKDIDKRYASFKEDFQAALVEAIRTKDNKGVRHFAEKTTDINAETNGTTPLIVAIEKENEKLASFFVEKGAIATKVGADQYSPLTKAVRVGMHQLVETILEKQGEAIAEVLNDKEQFLSPQFLAYKDARMMNLLLESGADPHFGGKDGMSPIAKAIEKASVALLPVLVRNKVNLDELTDGKRPIEWAIDNDRTDWLNGLIKERVDLTLALSDGMNALEYAKAKEARPDVVAMLEEEMS